MTVKTFILRDIPYSDPEHELEMILFELNENGIAAEIIADSAGPQDLNNYSFDLLIIDYGGMAAMGAFDTALFNLRYTLNWLEDHPSVTAIVWTMFTAEIAKEIYDSFEEAPANVFIYSGKYTLSDEKWNQVRALLGVTKREN